MWVDPKPSVPTGQPSTRIEIDTAKGQGCDGAAADCLSGKARYTNCKIRLKSSGDACDYRWIESPWPYARLWRDRETVTMPHAASNNFKGEGSGTALTNVMVGRKRSIVVNGGSTDSGSWNSNKVISLKSRMSATISS